VTVIIDASVISAFLLKEEGWKDIGAILEDGTFATELVVTETCNAILSAVRRKRINEEEAREALKILVDFIDANIKIVRQDGVLLSEAFQNAKENDLAIYDSIHIVLARKLRGSLASRGPKQIEVAKKSKVNVISV
jgi:predicted nucleic acid-binding protein